MTRRTALRDRSDRRGDPRGMALAVAVALGSGGVALSDAAGETPPHRGEDLRAAADDLAALGRAEADPAILAAALALLMQGGARADPGDPWGGDALLAEALALALAQDDAAAGAALDRLAARGRGVVDGTARRDLRLGPGESQTIGLLVAGGEPALVEAWLRRGPEGADIDLTVTAAGEGVEIAADLGPLTGVPGFRAFAEWLPEACAAVEVTLVNRGTVPAAVVFLAPPASRSDCGG